jgi:hypothetical protein
LPAIEGSERDSTQDWIVPQGVVPTVHQLEARIDEALVIARVSEEGVREVGEMAIDAAKQARRAAEAAEKSAAAAAAAQVKPPTPQPEGPPVEEIPAPPLPPRFEVRFRSFTERADRVSARLRQIGAHPAHSSAPSVGAGRQRGDY